jgi:hypothetical protein
MYDSNANCAPVTAGDATSCRDKEKHEVIMSAIYSLNDVSHLLSEVIGKIEGSSSKECAPSEDKKMVSSFDNLIEVLDHSPEQINRIREDLLQQVEHLRRLLF